MKENMKIFLADDDEDDRAIFVSSAKEVDDTIECITTNNGQDALRFLMNEHNTVPDFIFLDLRMPRISGKQCLEEIRKSKRLLDTPVFIYTTSDDVQAAKDLRKMGAVHFITKPLNPSEVYYILSVVLTENWEIELKNAGSVLWVP